MGVLKKGNSNAKSLSYMSLVRPIRSGTVQVGSDKRVRLCADFQIMRTTQVGEPWSSVRRYLAFTPGSKHTPEDGNGNL